MVESLEKRLFGFNLVQGKNWRGFHLAIFVTLRQIFFALK